MAEVLESFNWRYHGLQKYPWEKWLDGQIWHLRAGKDYHCQSRVMVASVHLHCRRHGLKAKTEVTETGLVIQAIKPKQETP